MLDFSEGPDIDDAGRRAVVTARLADELRAELEERGEIDLYAEIEAPLVAVLARMEAAGIGVTGFISRSSARASGTSWRRWRGHP